MPDPAAITTEQALFCGAGAALMLVRAMWGLWTGHMPGRHGGASRREQPASFWIDVTLSVLIGCTLAFVALCYYVPPLATYGQQAARFLHLK